MWTWLERLHDVNNNGIMEADEYRMETVTLNRMSQNLRWTCLWLRPNRWSPAANAGRMSVVLKGEDLGELEGGGGFAESTDLATVSVQRRADTVIDGDNIGLDRMEGRLLAGHEHRFTFTLGDANGIESLESLRLALFGEANESMCFIHYEPRFAGLEYDEACFSEPPQVDVQQRPLLTTYDVTVSFRLDWNMSRALDGTVGVPSLKVFDEGQDLGLGLYRLSGLAWTASDRVDLRWVDIVDTQAPFGQNNDRPTGSIATKRWNTGWVSITLTRPFLRRFPEHRALAGRSRTASVSRQGDSTYRGWSDDVRRRHERKRPLHHGSLVVPEGFETHAQRLAYNLVVDDVIRRPGMLENFASNELKVPITVSVSDDTHMPLTALEMTTVFYRMGQPVEGSRQTVQLPWNATVNEFTVYSGTVDFLPNGVELTRSDVLMVSFNATDRSGRELTGQGNRSVPLYVSLTWFAFEPVMTDLSANPRRPVVGENVSVYARVANDGLLGGEFQIIPRRRRASVDQRTAYLDTGSGRICLERRSLEGRKVGLNVEIVDHGPRIPVPWRTHNLVSPTTPPAAWLSLSALSLLVAGMVLFIVRNEREKKPTIWNAFVALLHRRPPPKPWDLLDTLQEE